MSMTRYDRRYGGTGANHWQDWVNLILAIWLFISPWILNFAAGNAAGPGGGAGAGNIPTTAGSAVGNASWNAWVLGVIVGLVAIAAISRIAPWQEWINLILGVWIFIAPWVLGFSGIGNPAWDHWIVGFLIFIFALWDLSTIRLGGGLRAGAEVPDAVDMAHAGSRPGDPLNPVNPPVGEPPAQRPLDRRP